MDSEPIEPDLTIIYSLSDLTSRVIDLYTSFHTTPLTLWLDCLGDQTINLLETLNQAGLASESVGPTLTATDDLTVDLSQSNEEGIDFVDNPFQLAVNELGPRLIASMLIQAVDQGLMIARGEEHSSGVKTNVLRFCEINEQGRRLTTRQMDILVRAQLAVWPTIDSDDRAWEIVARYILARDEQDEAQLKVIRAQVDCPVKEEVVRSAVEDAPEVRLS